MILTTEMREIVQYLSRREDYAIFAGFAAYLHTGIEPSEDIDVFFEKKKIVELIVKDFEKKGWKEKNRYENDKALGITIEKEGTTFDVIYTKSSAEVLLPRRIKMEFEGKDLWVISKEALFLTKLVSISSEGRADSKIKRDRKVVNGIRDKIDMEELRKIISETKDVFWKRGFF